MHSSIKSKWYHIVGYSVSWVKKSSSRTSTYQTSSLECHIFDRVA